VSAPASLKDGDIILIGDYRMAIKEDRPSAPWLSLRTLPLRGHTRAAGWAAAPPAAEVHDALEAQPTIPLHSLGDEATLPESASRRRVSSSLADSCKGASYSRPPFLGDWTHARERHRHRHKSISRHHARICAKVASTTRWTWKARTACA